MDIFIIGDQEADRLLDNVCRWVKRLKDLNVPADIAVSVAQAFLAPISGDAEAEPRGMTTDAVNQACYEPEV